MLLGGFFGNFLGSVVEESSLTRHVAGGNKTYTFTESNIFSGCLIVLKENSVRHSSMKCENFLGSCLPTKNTCLTDSISERDLR